MDELIARYVEEVSALQSRRSATLSADDLADIARELGLSEADLAAIEEEVGSHLLRARNFAANELWDEAMVEAERVSALAPHNAEAIELQGRIHAGRWKAEGRDDDRTRALRLYQQVVQLDPSHTQAYLLIRELKQPREKWPYIVGGVVSAGLAGAVSWAATSSLLVVVPMVLVVLVLAGLSTRAARPRDQGKALPAPESFAGLLPAASEESLSDHPDADRSKLGG